MKIGGKPSGPPLDLAISSRIARLTYTEENLTLLKHVLVTGGVETTGICPISVRNIDAKITQTNKKLRGLTSPESSRKAELFSTTNKERIFDTIRPRSTASDLSQSAIFTKFLVKFGKYSSARRYRGVTEGY